jgi:hypothetical protein
VRWLLHGNVATACADALHRHGHKTLAIADVGLAADASPDEVFKTARVKQFDVTTADPELVNAPFEDNVAIAPDRVLVYLQLDASDPHASSNAIDRLFERYPRLTPGRLYTVTATRVKVRQFPS